MNGAKSICGSWADGMLFGKEVGEEVGQLSAWTARDVSRQRPSALQAPGPAAGVPDWLPGHSQMGANTELAFKLRIAQHSSNFLEPRNPTSCYGTRSPLQEMTRIIEI